MRSIDNLREYVLTAASVNATTRAVLAGYIDGIERDVAALTDERDMLKRQWEAGVDFDQRLEACADNRADVTLFGVDYTALPEDADGVPIHAGDVLDGYGKTIEVVEMRYGRSGWVLISRDGNGYADCAAFSHHHAPTVEDVLREFAHVGIHIAAKHGIKAGEIDFYADEDAIAEYAARLRLAGEGA